jgi:hypothetical protein
MGENMRVFNLECKSYAVKNPLLSSSGAGNMHRMNELSSAKAFLDWVDAQILRVSGEGPRRSDRAVSIEATGSPDTIRSIRRNLEGGKQHGVSTETVRKFEAYFGTAIAASAPVSAPRIIRPSGPEPTEVVKVGEGWPDVGDDWIDVRGVTVGGDDSYFYFGDVIDQVRRPPGIKNAKNVAALNVSGDSMEPRFAPGELIYVQLREPAPGDDVVVELYSENEGDPAKSFLKRFVKQTGRRIHCKQFNPMGDLEFDRGEVRHLWRVLTLRDLLG